jgi:hypothetical protein
LRGGGVEERGYAGDVGFGHLDLNAADPNAIGQDEDAPWLKDAEESEERELVAGVRQKIVFGKDTWYDDTMAAVPRNKQGACDMHAYEGYGDIFKSHQELLEEEVVCLFIYFDILRYTCILKMKMLFITLAIDIYSFSRRIPRATWARWMRRA